MSKVNLTFTYMFLRCKVKYHVIHTALELSWRFRNRLKKVFIDLITKTFLTSW